MRVRQVGSSQFARQRSHRTKNILREFIFSIFVRIPVVLAVFIVVFVIILMLAVLLPPVYTSNAKFSMVLPKSFDPLENPTAWDYKNMFQRQLTAQKELITSNRVLVKVMEELNYGNPQDPALWTNRIRERLKVTPPKGETFEATNFFYLNYEDKSPHRATLFAKTITQKYLETLKEIEQEKADQAYAFFKEQTRELFDKMQEKERILRQFEKDQAVILLEMLNMESRGSANLETGPNALLTQFLRKYHELREELAGIQKTISSVEKQRKGGIPVVLPEMEVAGRAITVFKRKVAQLQIQLNEMKPRFREKFEQLRQVEKELNLNIGSLRRELERSVQAKKVQAKSIEARLTELQKTIEGLKEKIKTTAEQRSRYEQLKQDYALAKDAYVSARNQLEQARLAQALNKQTSNITLVDEPIVPDKPSKPNRPLIVILGFFTALFLAIATALLLDYFDHSIRKTEEIEEHLEINIIGSIPKMS